VTATNRQGADFGPHEKEITNMRAIFKTTITLVFASVLAASALTASPASARQLPGGGSHGAGMHGGGFHGGGFHAGNAGGALAILGLAGFAAGALIDASSNNCISYRAVYDAYGNYLGQRA
jgi:hypothetical protein